MRASSLFLALAGASFLVACEDGPAQTYAPSPPGARDKWNDGKTAGATDTGAKQGFDQTDVGGNNKQEICTGAQKAARWAALVKEPINPPLRAAGLDMSGGPAWDGLTIEEAEAINCQSDNDGDAFGDGNQVNSWGDDAEVFVEYLVSTRKIVGMTLLPGYLGTMKFKSEDGHHVYEIALQTQIQKDGHPFTLDWVGNGGRNFATQADELYRALMSTYAPGLPIDPAGATCFDTARCIRGNIGDYAYFWVPAIGWAMWVDSYTASQPTPSKPTRIDLEPVKLLPFAYAGQLMKLDAEGPLGPAGKLGNSATECVLKLGQSFADFVKDCVEVTGNVEADSVAHNKLVGGLTHNLERFEFDISGVDLNFSDSNLGPHDVVRDGDVPGPEDFSTEFSIDQSTLGPLLNDVDATGTLDLHGAGAVYKEYARLVRKELLRQAGIADGDVEKCLYPQAIPPNFDHKAFAASLPAWCTGFEGFLTAAPPTGPNDRNDLGLDVLKVKGAEGYDLGLRLGHQQGSFCMDPTGDLSNGYRFCEAPWGAAGDLFSTSFDRVVKFMGHGDPLNLPIGARDVRFFFQQYMIALVKYLHVGGENPVRDLAGVSIDYDDLFFDSEGSGQFEMAEYIDRRFASKTQPPTDFMLVADVKNGIFSFYDFSRELYRGEEALYGAILENQTDGLGQEENALLTNIFGSPIIANGWHDADHKSAFQCAIADPPDPAHCNGQMPPLDENGHTLKDDQGRPILLRYRGAFEDRKTPFTLGDSEIEIVETIPNLQQALVRIPTHHNPYDRESAAGPAIETLIPWVPKQPGVGFPVALSGTLDKFVETAQLDFSGTTISANVDYELSRDANGKELDTLNLLAVETTDFLGDVFLCKDGPTGDLLRARMYTPVQDILDWLGDHPTARDSCGIVIRYSPYNNYVDYVTSLQAGVRLGVTQGGGFGRVVDVTLFVPGQ